MNLRKILKLILLKKYFNKTNDEVWLKVPTNYTSQAERDKVMEATMDKLEQIIYKNFKLWQKKKSMSDVELPSLMGT